MGPARTTTAAATTRHHADGIIVRQGERSDRWRVREVLAAAYQQYDAVLPAPLLEGYLADILDLESRDGTGELLVAEHDRWIVGAVTYYPDAGLEGFGWPSGWAGLRALGVEPAASTAPSTFSSPATTASP